MRATGGRRGTAGRPQALLHPVRETAQTAEFLLQADERRKGAQGDSAPLLITYDSSCPPGHFPKGALGSPGLWELSGEDSTIISLGETAPPIPLLEIHNGDQSIQL